jgi:hypothetical protein
MGEEKIEVIESEASTVEVHPEQNNFFKPKLDEFKSTKSKSKSETKTKLATCNVVLLDGREYECKVNVSALNKLILL